MLGLICLPVGRREMEELDDWAMRCRMVNQKRFEQID